MSKIQSILDPNVRGGIGKTGKPWTMMSILTDDGKTASIFAPAAIGDEVTLAYNDQYKNYSATRVKSVQAAGATQPASTSNSVTAVLVDLQRQVSAINTMVQQIKERQEMQMGKSTPTVEEVDDYTPF